MRLCALFSRFRFFHQKKNRSDPKRAVFSSKTACFFVFWDSVTAGIRICCVEEGTAAHYMRLRAVDERSKEKGRLCRPEKLVVLCFRILGMPRLRRVCLLRKQDKIPREIVPQSISLARGILQRLPEIITIVCAPENDYYTSAGVKFPCFCKAK